MPTVKTRQEWGGRPPSNNPVIIPTPTPRLWLHHTASNTWHGSQGVRDIQDYHMDIKNWNDIAYSYLVDTDGVIYTGRGFGIAGAHTEGDNSKSHAICCMGDFTTLQPPTPMIESIVWLIRFGHTLHKWPLQLTGGHRDAPQAQTSCPGDRLYALIPHINRLVLDDGTGDDGAMAWTDAQIEEMLDLLRQINHQVSGDARLKAIASDVDRIADKIVKPD